MPPMMPISAIISPKLKSPVMVTMAIGITIPMVYRAPKNE